MENSPLTWRKACGQVTECVEVAVEGDGVAVRSSNDPDGVLLHFTQGVFREFLECAKSGALDDFR